MLRTFQLAVACVAVLVATAGQVQASPITSSADPALNGATVETFDALALGPYASPLSLSGLSVEWTGAGTSFSVQTGANGQFAPPNPIGDRFVVKNAGVLTFDFDSPVSAFGIVVGAANNPQTMTAFDGDGATIETLGIPDQVLTLPAPASGFYGISSSSGNIAGFSIGVTDATVFDDLHFVTASSSVPEPSSIALLAIGAVGFMGYGWRRKRKQAA